MNEKLNCLLGRTNTVGVIASKEDLKIALRNPDIADIFELRIDCFVSSKGAEALHRLGKPMIVTVRDANEGGKRPDWTVETRKALYRKHMKYATLVDVEASTAMKLKEIIDEAKSQGRGVIMSLHVFDGVWRTQLVEYALRLCRDMNGDIFKIAIQLMEFPEFNEFLVHIDNIAPRMFPVQLAPMAIGKYGKVSRLLFAENGSPLVYGYLAEARVPGQWHVSEIREMMKRVFS